jgi:hypothetical protein
MSSVDKFILRNMQVFRANKAGTITNRPSTIAHIAAATKAMNDKFIGRTGRVALIDTTVEESFSQLSQFTSLDYGPDAAAGLRDAVLGRRYGFGFLTDPNSGAFVRSDVANSVAGTVLTNGTPAAGATTLNIDGITGTAGAGILYAGTVITLAGDTTRYVIRKDVVAAANEVDLEIYPALAAEATNDAAVTFEAAGYSNIVFHPQAVAAAIVAPTPLTGNSAVQSFNGVSIRVSMDSSIVTLADSVVYDVLVGCRVIQPDGGAAFCG